MIIAATEFPYRRRRRVVTVSLFYGRIRRVASGEARKAGLECGDDGIPGIVVHIFEHLAASTADLACRDIGKATARQGAEQAAEKRFVHGLDFFDRHRESRVVAVQCYVASCHVERYIRPQILARIQHGVVATNQPVRALSVDARPVRRRTAADPTTLQAIEQPACRAGKLRSVRVPAHGDNNGAFSCRRRKVLRGANAQPRHVRVGAAQGIEHHFTFWLWRRVVVECDAEEDRVRGWPRVLRAKRDYVLQAQCQSTNAIDHRPARRRRVDAPERCADFAGQRRFARQRRVGAFEHENLFRADQGIRKDLRWKRA